MHNTQDKKNTSSNTHNPSNPKQEGFKYGKESLKNMAQGANDLSVGISLVVAVGIGIALGYGMEQLFKQVWLFWLGVAWGVAAAFLNLYKAYQRAQKEAQELAKDPRYSYHAKLDSENSSESSLSTKDSLAHKDN